MSPSRSSKRGRHPEDMGAADGIYQDIAGAPFRIGDKVKVVYLADETADVRFFNREGMVLYFEYTCGCGQSFPDDPMIGIKFARCVEEFWKEELRLIGRSPVRSAAKKLSHRSARLLLRKLVGEEQFHLLVW